MATTLQFRRGTTSTSNATTGQNGELFIDTDKKTVVVHDGSTAGGSPLLTETSTQTFSNKTVGSDLLPSADSAYDLGSPSAKWKSLYLSGSTIFLGDASISASGTSVALPAGTTIGASGAVLDSDKANALITTAINNLVDGAPVALDTLNELAAALNDDASFAATITAQLAALPDSAQVRTLVSAVDAGGDGSFSYNSSTGEFTYTGPSAAEVRAHLSGSSGISYNSTTGEITHADTSSASSVNNSGNTFIQDITIDSNGHITAIGSGTVTVNDATITVSAGTGLSGGGDFTTNQGGGETITLDVDLSELTDMTDTMVGTDEFIVLDAGADRRKAANEIGLSIFNNDAGFTSYDSANTVALVDSDYVNARVGAGTDQFARTMAFIGL